MKFGYPAKTYFNSQPREGGWPVFDESSISTLKFQLTAARRRLGGFSANGLFGVTFQLTAARRRLDSGQLHNIPFIIISTHSRAKAAGFITAIFRKTLSHFNSQPREGGWASLQQLSVAAYRFQLTAARRRLADLPIQSPLS